MQSGRKRGLTLRCPSFIQSRTSLAYEAKSSGVLMNAPRVGRVIFKLLGESLKTENSAGAPYASVQTQGMEENRNRRRTEAFPYMTKVPLDLMTSKSSSNVSLPTPSYTACTPFPSVKESTFFTFSSEESVVRRTWCAPFFFANSAFSGLDVVAMTLAPL